MDNQFTLKKGEVYYTHASGDVIRILAGAVCVYIAPWSEKDGAAGRRILLCEAEAERMIPAFSWRDKDYQQWRFLIVAKSDQVTAVAMPGAATLILKRRFLSSAGIQTFDSEGYENSLTEYYKSKTLNENIFIQRGEKNVAKVTKTSVGVIVGAVSGKEMLQGGSEDILYGVMKFACKKCGAELLPKEKVESIATEMTVREIARASHLICRDVVLDVDWFKHDCGVLIVTLKGRLGVCYPTGSGKYRLYDSADGSDKPLSAAALGQLEPNAWSVRRTLPRHKLTKKDIVRFVKISIRTGDVVRLIILGLLCTLIGVLQPKLNQLIYDEYIPMGNETVLLQVCLVIAATMLGNVFISIVKQLQEFRIPCRAGYELQDALYFRIFELPESFFRKFDSADLAQRLMGVSSLTNSLVSKIIVNGLALILAIIYIIQMIHYSWKLTLAGILMLLVYALLVHGLYRLTIRHAKKAAEYQGEATGKLYQYLNGVDKIRMAGAEERAILEYTLPVSREQQEDIRANHVSSMLVVLMDVSATLFSMVLYYMMVKSKLNLTMGNFMAFTTAFGSFSGAVTGFVNAANECLSLKPALERIRPITQTPTENEEQKDTIEELRGDIALEHVTFGYDETAIVLNDLSFHIHPGEYVAFVGPSGCGKSTILKLLLGFESPRAGRVLYDGKDLSTVDKHSLRKQLGVVLQNGKLIAGSIYENITIANPHPNMKDVTAVIEDVGLKEDIAGMPMGIHTVLSESGGTISGGQQQRILIARAIFNNPSVLYFDEATSALDNITQAKVCESLEKRHMTRVVIAHRLSTVQNCDRILVIHEGHIVEEGDYETLMMKRGMFYQMAVRQLAEMPA